jgi:membrane protein required for colicin V production
MTWVDYAVAAVLALSIVWGVWRGLVREVLSILAWVIAFLAANLLAGPLAPRLAVLLDSPPLRVAAAYVVVFIVVLFAVSLVAYIVSRLVHAAGLSGVDRMLGAVFGAARGVLIVMVLVFLAGLTGLPRQPEWRESASGPVLASIANRLKPWLPQSFAERLSYD